MERFEKASNASTKVSNECEKVSNAFEKYVPMLREAGQTDKFIQNISCIFAKCGTDAPFGQANVMEWLNCSKSKATNIINAMKVAKMIKKIVGLGAGKYKFITIKEE